MLGVCLASCCCSSCCCRNGYMLPAVAAWNWPEYPKLSRSSLSSSESSEGLGAGLLAAAAVLSDILERISRIFSSLSRESRLISLTSLKTSLMAGNKLSLISPSTLLLLSTTSLVTSTTLFMSAPSPTWLTVLASWLVVLLSSPVSCLICASSLSGLGLASTLARLVFPSNSDLLVVGVLVS